MSALVQNIFSKSGPFHAPGTLSNGGYRSYCDCKTPITHPSPQNQRRVPLEEGHTTPPFLLYSQQYVTRQSLCHHDHLQMGDAPLENAGSQDAHQAPLIAKGHSTMSPPAQSPTALSPPASQGEAPSNAFVSQFDLTQSPGNRQSSFSMNAVATALPHVGYSAPYGPGAPPQQGPYSGVNSAMLAQAMPPQYGIHGMHAPGPPYYPQQGPPMQQYYPMPMYHGHPPPDPLQGRQNMAYAQNQLPPNMLPHAPPGPPPFHYYPTSPSFANPGRPPPQMSNRPGPIPQKQVDPRTAPPPIVTGSSGRGMGYGARSPNPNTNAEELGTVDGNQGVVRGPPRKPKQRG